MFEFYIHRLFLLYPLILRILPICFYLGGLGLIYFCIYTHNLVTSNIIFGQTFTYIGLYNCLWAKRGVPYFTGSGGLQVG
jgi:hypothetical protein